MSCVRSISASPPFARRSSAAHPTGRLLRKMTPLLFTLAVVGISPLAGFLGSLPMLFGIVFNNSRRVVGWSFRPPK